MKVPFHCLLGGLGVLGLLGCADSDPEEMMQPSEVIAWGNDDLLEGQFEAPQALALDPATGDVYVADVSAETDNPVHVFSNQGTFIRRWAAHAYISGMAIGPDRTLFATDRYRSRVFNVGLDGRFIREWGRDGSGAGEFRAPKDIAVGGGDRPRVYVADSGNDRIQVFGPHGGLVLSWGAAGSGPGEFSNPTSIVIDTTLGFVYVGDSGNKRVQKFDTQGNWVASWGRPGYGPGEFDGELTVALGANGDVVVQTYVNVQRFTSDGGLLSSLTGEGDPFLHTGTDIEVDIARGTTYTLGLQFRGLQANDSGNHLLRRIGERRASAPGQMYFPRVIAATNDGSVLVKDEFAVQRFTGGVYQTEWNDWSIFGGDITSLATSPDGSLFACVGFRHIRNYSIDGQRLREWSLDQAQFVIDLEVDALGRIWIVDQERGRVTAFSSTGELLESWGKFGKEPGALWSPRSIAVEEGVVAVRDRQSVQIFDESGTLLKVLLKWEEGDELYEHLEIRDHKLYASDPGGRLSIFDLTMSGVGISGTLVGDLIVSTPGGGDFAVDTNGVVYWLFPFTARVIAYDFEGPSSGPAFPTAPED